MDKKIQVLKEMVESKKSAILSESIKIFKSKKLDSEKIWSDKDRKYKYYGPGYWVYISSDNPEGNDFKDEALHMSSVLNLAKSKKFAFIKDNPGVGKPIQYKNPETKQFGWGYYLEDKMVDIDASLPEKRLGWLKGLVRKYNTQEGLKDDIESGKLTVDQVGEIQELISDIEDASVMNPETKAKLEKYLDELTEAVENDEVFEFLTQKYNEAKEFLKNNSRAGTTKEGHQYSVTNAFIIRAADPAAVLAAQKSFWKGRGYRVKPGVRGISIRFPKGSGTGRNTEDTARWLQRNPEAFKAYKEKHGINPNASFKDVMRANPEMHGVGMAHKAISSKTVRTVFTKPETDNFGTVYTDTMVEPIPGMEVMSIQDMIDTGSNEPIQDPFHVPQKELDSEAHKEKLNTLFKAVLDVAEEDSVNTHGADFKDGDINEFNKVINALAFDKAVSKLPSMMGVKRGAVTPQIEEMIYGYSEAMANIIKKHYGLPSEESKYNVARQGIDREEMQKMYSEIIRISHDLINRIDSKVNVEQPALNEVRKIVRSVLRNI